MYNGAEVPMWKLHILALASVLLSACTVSLPDLAELLVPATPTPPAVASATVRVPPSATPTVTPTRPTATFTLTPTLIGGARTATEISAPVTTPTFVQLVLGSALTRTSYVDGFVSITLSTAQVYWGDCNLSRVTVTAQVSEPFRVANVSLFVRLKSKLGSGATDWDAGTLMTGLGNGTYSHTIEAEDIRNYFNYADAWIHLQLISIGGNARIIDRTPVFSSNLGLAACP